MPADLHLFKVQRSSLTRPIERDDRRDLDALR